MAISNLDILLVEDNLHDVRFISEALKEMNIKLNMQHLTDGVEAINFLKGRDKYSDRNIEDRPKLIMTDLRMPRMDGCELLKLLKSEENTKDIPVVVMTTSTLENDIVKCYESGANSYLIKPIDFDSFTGKIKMIFDYWFKTNTTKDLNNKSTLYYQFT